MPYRSLILAICWSKGSGLPGFFRRVQCFARGHVALELLPLVGSDRVHDCREQLGDKIPDDCRPPLGHEGRPRLASCAGAEPKCEGLERGPKHLKCLSENGSAKCKAEVAEVKKHFEERRKRD